MCKAVLAVFIFVFGAALTAAEPEKAPPKELVQYVLEARKLGLGDAEIQRNAVKAGWPAAAVNDAMVSARGVEQPAVEVAAATAPMAAPPPEHPAPAVANLPKDRGVPDDYQIGAGDVLEISVWKEPDASVPNVVVRPDGKISMPLLKEVEVIGLTPSAAERVITEQISKFITGADVTVVVTKINSKKVYVVGAVKKEGPLAYNYRMSVLQAISEAGGLTDYARRKKIYVLREDNGKQYRLLFDYDAVLKGEHMELNISLLPNDTLVVPH